MRAVSGLVFLAMMGCTVETVNGLGDDADPDLEPVRSQVEPPVQVSAPLADDALAPVLPGELQDGHATGSSTMAVSPDGLVYTVNPDAGTITRVSPDTGVAVEVDVGAEPSRIALHGTRVYVTLRAERRLVVLDTTALEAGPIASVDVGPEPVGVVVRGDGERVYVAVSQTQSVVELDAQSLAPMRSFTWDSGEPRYLALAPEGTQLFVGFGRGTAGVARVDLAMGRANTVAVPGASNPFLDVGSIPLASRVTGDMWVDGALGDGNLLVPVLYLDTTTEGVSLDSVEEFTSTGGYYQPEAVGAIDTVTPAVAEIGLAVDGSPVDGRAILAEISVDGLLISDTQWVGSYLSGVTSQGGLYAAGVEASEAVLVFDPTTSPGAYEVQRRAGTVSEESAVMLETANLELVSFAPLDAGVGPSGVRFAGGRLFANAAFDNALVEVDLPGGVAEIEAGHQTVAPEIQPALASWTVAEDVLPSDVREGRALFYSARGATMGGTGVSCSTCHFEGRNDGITWAFDDGLRQTPSLAGVVSDTEPMTWRSSVATIQDEAEITTLGRMGGTNLTPDQLDAIAAYVDWTRIPDLPAPDGDAVARGAAIFELAGCGSCHSGARHTNRQRYTIRGVALDTPSLTGVAATGPWLHDGSAKTLSEVIDLSITGEMGETWGLGPQERDDLEAYLRSL